MQTMSPIEPVPVPVPPVPLPAQRLDHLRALEAESIHIMREVVAEFERPVMLYSIGKDSSVLLRLAQKAFYPGPIPFPLLHIDTTYKFREMIEFRDRYARGDRRPPDRPHQRARRSPTARSPSWSARSAAAACSRPSAAGRARGAAASTRPSAAPGATRSGRAPRSASSRSATRRASGIRSASGRSSGTCSTAASSPARASASFPLSNWTEIDVWQYIHARTDSHRAALFREGARGDRPRRRRSSCSSSRSCRCCPARSRRW